MPSKTPGVVHSDVGSPHWFLRKAGLLACSFSVPSFEDSLQNRSSWHLRLTSCTSSEASREETSEMLVSKGKTNFTSQNALSEWNFPSSPPL